MCDARDRESLLETVDARMDAKFAQWDLERTKRMFRVVMPAMLIVYAIVIFAIA
jgi:hypothetical protein